MRPENYDKIDWMYLSSNESDEALELLMKPENYNKINWRLFSI